jgi:hypothetical protein
MHKKNCSFMYMIYIIHIKEVSDAISKLAIKKWSEKALPCFNGSA